MHRRIVSNQGFLIKIAGLNLAFPPPWIAATATTASPTKDSPGSPPNMTNSTLINLNSINPSDGSFSPPHTPPNASPRTTAGTQEFQAALLKAAEAYRRGDYAHVVDSCLQVRNIYPSILLNQESSF